MRKIKRYLPALLLLAGLALGGCFWLLQPLEARLTATPASGPAPLSVTFSAAGSTGPIVSFTLDFETDGIVDYTGTDITLPISHTYTAAGVYTATLTVVDAQGRSDSATVTITVTAPPTTSVSLGAIPASGPAPLEVNFWAVIQAAPGRRIKHIALDYDGDGTAEDEADVDFESYNMFIGNYEYTEPGNYTAVLTVTDNATPPHSVSATATINVTSPPPEITNFEINGDGESPVTVTVGAAVTFEFSAQAGHSARKLVKWELQAGDGYVVTTAIPPTSTISVTHIYTYTQTGSYTASIKVWDDLNNTDEATLEVEVETP
ncbi:MAG: PKD domain-containing protein [Candidatus Bipolaricaulota bacterium]|nr:PKD domain-containing protein [Candidatus Bipolaricaulota bacterium]MDW8126824.1 PKD domain-containing protein [Candidatus Bipolaricaulota bacterium]